MTQSQPPITGTTHPLSFSHLSPRDFERLCLWLVEREGWERAEHLGAAGSEQGRDIVAWRENRLWAFQCKRVQTFGPKNALTEIEKILALPQSQRPRRSGRCGPGWRPGCTTTTSARRETWATIRGSRIQGPGGRSQAQERMREAPAPCGSGCGASDPFLRH